MAAVFIDEFTVWLADRPCLGGAAVFPGRVAESFRAWPAVVVEQISGTRDFTLDGPSGLASPRVQLSCVGLTYGDAKKLANAIAQAVADGGINGFRGSIGTLTVGAVIYQDERDFYDAPANANDVAKYTSQLDFFISYAQR